MKLDPVAPGAVPDLSDEVAHIQYEGPGRFRDAQTHRRARQNGWTRSRRHSTPRRSTRCSSCCRPGTEREGQHDQAGVRRRSTPRDARVTGFKVPTPLELQSRLSLESPSGGAAQGHHRRVQSVALRRRARGSGARPRTRGGLAAALPSRSTNSSASSTRERRHDPEVLPAHLEGRTARATCATGWMTRRNTGSSIRRIWARASGGTTTRRPTRT